jgi:DNA-binding MarR family transcriptional regulator
VVSPSPQQEPLGLLIVAARQALRQVICARVRAFRLTSQQFWAVVVLHSRPGITLGELAAFMHLEAPATSRIAQLLARRKLLQMSQDHADRRRVHLLLTEQGARLADELVPIAEEFRAAVIRGIGDADLVAVRAGLKRVVANLSEFEPERADAPRHGRRRASPDGDATRP